MTNSSTAAASCASVSEVPVRRSSATIIGIITCGQPSLTIVTAMLSGSKSSWMTVSLQCPPRSSISNVTVER